MLKIITIIGASSAQIDDSYLDAARNLTIDIINRNIAILFGGGAYGIMGAIANTALKYNGKITGVVNKQMQDVESIHKEIKKLVYASDFYERKKLLLNKSDGLIVLPGGTGTMDELFEALTLKRLGLYTKPIVILNTNNYFNDILSNLRKSADENFINTKHLNMWNVIQNPIDAIPCMLETSDWDKHNKYFATNLPRKK